MSDKKNFYYLVPNSFTIFSLVAGLFAINLSFSGNFHAAVLFILVAAFFDTIDGFAARILKTSSNFGVQLDSLCDAVSFGVAPTFVIFNWVLYEFGTYGFIISSTLAIACVLRLARFNVSAGKKSAPKKHFSGVPAPGGGMLAMAPIALSEGFGIHALSWLIMIYIVAVSLMMISNIPTLSLKGIRLRRTYIPIFLLIIGTFSVYFILNFWDGLAILALCYWISFLISAPYYLKKKRSGTL